MTFDPDELKGRLEGPTNDRPSEQIKNRQSVDQNSSQTVAFGSPTLLNLDRKKTTQHDLLMSDEPPEHKISPTVTIATRPEQDSWLERRAERSKTTAGVWQQETCRESAGTELEL